MAREMDNHQVHLFFHFQIAQFISEFSNKKMINRENVKAASLLASAGTEIKTS